MKSKALLPARTKYFLEVLFHFDIFLKIHFHFQRSNDSFPHSSSQNNLFFGKFFFQFWKFISRPFLEVQLSVYTITLKFFMLLQWKNLMLQSFINVISKIWHLTCSGTKTLIKYWWTIERLQIIFNPKISKVKSVKFMNN